MVVWLLSLPRSPCPARRSDTLLALGPWTRPDPRQLCKTPCGGNQSPIRRGPSAATCVLLRRWLGSVMLTRPRVPVSTSRRRIQRFRSCSRVPSPPLGCAPSRPVTHPLVAWLCNVGGTNRCNGILMPTVGASSRGKRCHVDRGWEGLINAESSPGLRRGDAAALRYQHLLLSSLCTIINKS